MKNYKYITIMLAIGFISISCNHLSDEKISKLAAEHNQEKIFEILGNECEHDGTKLKQNRYEFYLKIADKYNLKGIKEWIELNAIQYRNENALNALWTCNSHPSSLEMAMFASTNQKTIDYTLKFDQAQIYEASRKILISELDAMHQEIRKPSNPSTGPKISAFSVNLMLFEVILKFKDQAKSEKLNSYHDGFEACRNDINSIDSSDKTLSAQIRTLDDEYALTDPLSARRSQIYMEAEGLRRVRGNLDKKRMNSVDSINLTIEKIVEIIKNG